jgi:murein DD-endopeptidase MepM/ murein hydrolase activator NlpD
MVRVEIEIPRPMSLLFWSGAIVAAFVYFGGGEETATTADVAATPAAEGGSGKPQAEVVHEAEEDARALRIKQEILSRREDILRAELAELEAQRSNDPEFEEQLVKARERLAGLLLNKFAAERELAESFEQIWEAQGYAMHVSRLAQNSTREVTFFWPVDPHMGISAHFDDAAYQKLFGMPHQAVDIPVPQASVVEAAADGVVAKVTDNGYGFNSVVIKHTDGMATLYGHVSEFLVSEGDEVDAGEAIALSGGTPGTPGAGHMTTGAHLHFQVLKDGEPVDPLAYLPSAGGTED